MSGSISCPKCGTTIRKGSTFCLKCGTRIVDGMAISPITPGHDELPPSMLDEISEEGSDEISLPDLEEWDKWAEEDDPLKEATLDELEDTEVIEHEVTATQSEDEALLSWEEGVKETDIEPEEELESRKIESPSSLTWETPQTSTSEIREGMPFKEIEPPKVIDHDAIEAHSHEIPEADKEVVSHLFPHGRGDTSEDFIDAVVGKPKKIGAEISASVVETPTCPECGHSTSTDAFDYPDYVYEAMGRARMEHGMSLLRENEHERAIEQFEIAKKLYEHSGNEKMVEDATRRVDQGYDSMAEHHFIQGENLLKEGQFEWSVVQFKKARELYMFSTDAKKRAKCSQRVRDAYEEWGKALEDDGDQEAKSGETRSALAKYTEAAEKYREADVPKRLRGLEKKIRNA